MKKRSNDDRSSTSIKELLPGGDRSSYSLEKKRIRQSHDGHEGSKKKRIDVCSDGQKGTVKRSRDVSTDGQRESVKKRRNVCSDGQRASIKRRRDVCIDGHYLCAVTKKCCRSTEDDIEARCLPKVKNNAEKHSEGSAYTERPERPILGKRRLETDTNQEEDRKRAKPETEAAKTLERPLALIASQYRFHQVLGEGAFGSVMLASTPCSEIPVAVKVILKKNTDSLLREKHILQVVSGKPYLCNCYATFQNSKYAFIVMEYLSGGTLEQQLTSMGSLDKTTAIISTAEIVCGIEFLHKLGIIHRDLKLENIIIDRKGHIRICDFGLAVENVFGVKTIFGVAGTLLYRPPEIVNHEPYGSSADWWAFGVILFRLLTGKFPFNGDSIKRIKRLILRNEPIYPKELSIEALDILPKLLKKERHSRLGLYGNIRQHPFYASISWDKVENQTITPPFQPQAMQQYTYVDLPAADSFLEPQGYKISPEDANHIHGFSFACPEWS
ncbi:protein kinase C delta type-like [Pseudophryne corroboree]|uniref:protein kinase C delta type-like n=1 Tax=Pseudophryne corroboree TaxID=495146 RepID=UPI003081855D